MTPALIIVALAAVGVYLVRRVFWPATPGRSIDLGAVSSGWIAEYRREESPR